MARTQTKPSLSFCPSLPGIEGARTVLRVFSRAAPTAKQLMQIGFIRQTNGTYKNKFTRACVPIYPGGKKNDAPPGSTRKIFA